MAQRISWIDWAKIICIWLMVSCHAGQQGFLLSFSYQFHMPAFFIISGFLFRPRGVWKELQSMCIPILFYGIINLLLNLGSIIFHGYSNGIAINNLWGGVSQYMSQIWIKSLYCGSDVAFFQGFWFLEVLLFVRLLLQIPFIREYKILLAVVCTLFCCVQPYLQIPSSLSSLYVWRSISVLPFFILGVILKEKDVNLLVGSFEFKLGATLVFIMITLVQGLVGLFGYNYGINYSVFFINACLGSYLLFNICSLMPIRKWGTTLATGTLLILGLHGKIYPYLFKLFNTFDINSLYLPLFIGLLVLLLCYPFIYWLEKHCPILLGKFKKSSVN